MTNKATDVLIYTKTILSDDLFSEVARQVREIDGVLSFERTKHKPNFIMVAYRASQTRAITILNKLTRMGFNASLVGI